MSIRKGTILGTKFGSVGKIMVLEDRGFVDVQTRVVLGKYGQKKDEGYIWIGEAEEIRLIHPEGYWIEY